MPTKIEKDSVTGTETTGHEWDGIRELNNPLPKWWLYTLYVTIAFSAVWTLLYPSWPGVSSHFEGTLGTTQRKEVAAELAAKAQERAPMLQKIAASTLTEIRQNPELAAFAQTGGRQLFGDNCAPCHGPGGSGRSGGYPVLADDDWLWGGDDKAIQHTITHGVRNGGADARDSAMPRFGADGLLTDKQIVAVADHVLSLTGKAKSTPEGAQVYADNCAACHGPQGRGNAELGAPNLADAVWLYGDSRSQLIQQISAPKQGVMPAWGTRLDPAAVKMLTLYVHGLGGGK